MTDFNSTRIGLSKLDEYFFALGRFISLFAETEATVQEVLWHFAGVKSPVAPALFSGVRVEDARNKITRIAEAEGWNDERKATWKAISEQLSLVQQLRNDVVHYGAQWRGRHSWVISNRLFAHTDNAVKEFNISATMLNDASADLETIEHRLIAFTWPDAIPPEGRAGFDRALTRAWQYKRPRPTGHSRKTRNDTQGC